MTFINPGFIIPENNNKILSKPGRGSHPAYYGDMQDFLQDRKDRLEETQSIISDLDNKTYFVDDITENIYFQIKFKDDVKSKSSIPYPLLDSNHINLQGKLDNENYLAVSSVDNFKSFSSEIGKMELTPTNPKYEYNAPSGYLSAIDKISEIASESIIRYDKTNPKKLKAHIYLNNALSENEAISIANKMIDLEKNTDAFFSVETSGSKVVYGEFTTSFLDSISTPHPKNPITRVEEGITFKVSKTQEIKGNTDDIEVGQINLNSTVAILDTGIFSEHKFIKPFLIDQLDLSGDNDFKDHIGHGTFVASRTIFGHDLRDQISKNILKPTSKVLDVKIFDKNENVEDNTIKKAILEVITKYPNIKVFNLSLNARSNLNILQGKKSNLTRELDAIGHKYKVIIIVSSGNHNTYPDTDYPQCLEEASSIISSPGDITNGYSIGSIAQLSSSNTKAKLGGVSPFSRCGIDENLKCPQLVHYGGNIDKYGDTDGVGERGFSNISDEKICENVGTSFSAPLVSGICGNIYAYLDNMKGLSNKTDLAKALLIHSARYTLPKGSSIDKDSLNKKVGFGIPSFELAFDNSIHTATYLYSGVLEWFENQKKGNKNKHKIKFTVPPELKRSGGMIRVRGTLSYTTPINNIGDDDYTLSDVSLNLYKLNSKGNIGDCGLPKKADISYRDKWNPLKHFDITIPSSQIAGGDWEVLLELITRGGVEGSSFKQDYALVISIEDVTPDISQRVEIFNIIKNQYKQYIPLQQKTKVLV